MMRQNEIFVNWKETTLCFFKDFERRQTSKSFRCLTKQNKNFNDKRWKRHAHAEGREKWTQKKKWTGSILEVSLSHGGYTPISKGSLHRRKWLQREKKWRLRLVIYTVDREEKVVWRKEYVIMNINSWPRSDDEQMTYNCRGSQIFFLFWKKNNRDFGSYSMRDYDLYTLLHIHYRMYHYKKNIPVTKLSICHLWRIDIFYQGCPIIKWEFHDHFIRFPIVFIIESCLTHHSIRFRFSFYGVHLCVIPFHIWRIPWPQFLDIYLFIYFLFFPILNMDGMSCVSILCTSSAAIITRRKRWRDIIKKTNVLSRAVISILLSFNTSTPFPPVIINWTIKETSYLPPRWIRMINQTDHLYTNVSILPI
jgi:hypothetical protein